ncbi:hypothetical protein FBU30_001599 [Linnemannia zychae]|nr:hypothetical protein FBU30_001599 [Linnemannia zychae]
MSPPSGRLIPVAPSTTSITATAVPPSLPDKNTPSIATLTPLVTNDSTMSSGYNSGKADLSSPILGRAIPPASPRSPPPPPPLRLIGSGPPPPPVRVAGSPSAILPNRARSPPPIHSGPSSVLLEIEGRPRSGSAPQRSVIAAIKAPEPSPTEGRWTFKTAPDFPSPLLYQDPGPKVYPSGNTSGSTIPLDLTALVGVSASRVPPPPPPIHGGAR